MTITINVMANKYITKFKLYVEFTKPGICRAQILTVSIGFFLAKQNIVFNKTYIFLILATYLFSASACAANNVIEQKLDKKMTRTKKRGYANNQIPKLHAMTIIFTTFVIATLFVMQINLATTILSILTVLIYVFIYTPLKQLSWLNTLVGAIPGALPIIGGWVATETPIHPAAISMFFTLFSWQIPHFYALSINYLDDYRNAGFKMLPLLDNNFKSTKRQILIFTFLMIISSIYPFLVSFLNFIYFYGIIILSFVFLLCTIKFLSNFTKKNAKKLFILSIIYLPIWFILIIIDILFG